MAPVAEGVVSVLYRPLATMDELHVILLAAISEQTNDLSLLEKVFSLPRNVVVKELTVLEAYGLAQTAGDNWTATLRGQRLNSIRTMFQNRCEVDLPANGRQWLLGPGEFCADEMSRDKAEIEAQARTLGVADIASALKFLDERRRATEEFEAFMQRWPSQSQANNKKGKVGEEAVIESIKLAETDESLERLEELLATHIGQVAARFEESHRANVDANGDDATKDAIASLRKNGQDSMKKFDEARRTQRRRNQQVATVRMICEALIAGQWLAANAKPLADAFNTEPAAFIFRSSVPLMQPETPKKPPTPRVSSPPPTAKPKQEEEGVLRSLFRWLFG